MGKTESNRDYNRRFEKGVAVMTVAEFQKWNPSFTSAQAQERINMAKAFVAKLAPNSLQDEVDARLDEGGTLVTIGEFIGHLKAIGYKLDRKADAFCNSRWMSGPRAGKAFPCISLRPVQIDDRKAAWHFEARRDANFQSLQTLRGKLFFVAKGAICEI